MLKKWNLTPILQQLDHVKGNVEAKQEDKSRGKITENGHKRNGSDSARVFRRENSDFIVPSVRHSALFLESKNIRQSPFNSSSRRGSDVAGLVSKYTGPKPSEPILTDFNLGRGGGEWQPVRPRRERTEGDIVLQKSRQELRENLEARRIDVEMRFSREAEKMRKRNTRLVTESEVANSTSSTEERQVSRPVRG